MKPYLISVAETADILESLIFPHRQFFPISGESHLFERQKTMSVIQQQNQTLFERISGTQNVGNILRRREEQNLVVFQFFGIGLR